MIIAHCEKRIDSPNNAEFQQLIERKSQGS